MIHFSARQHNLFADHLIDLQTYWYGGYEFEPSTTKDPLCRERCSLNLSRAQTSSYLSGVVVKRGQLKYRPRQPLFKITRCTNVGFVDVCCTIDCVQGCLYTYSSHGKPLRVRLQWAHKQRAWQADRHQNVFTDKPRFNLWDHEGRIRVSCYAGEHFLPECVNERYSGLTPGVIVWDAISYPGRSNLLRIEAIFQQDNARLHVVKTVRDFGSAQHIQLLPWPAYSPDMSPIDHMWDLEGRRLVRNQRPAASENELLLRIQAIWNSLPQEDIQNLFEQYIYILHSHHLKNRVL
ncbi:transposable element Tcb2 transposase [Trichonephila clavipes]|nr:transposable element Tcb2 transposase [Trichonephila clavipes]